MFNLYALFHMNRAEREMDDELRFHLEKLIEQNLASGMSSEEARRAALQRFGNMGAIKEECRDSWGVRVINELVQDVRYGFRQLRHNPGFTAVAVITLALGIGANTAIFSVINAILLEPLPFHEPGRLVELWETETAPGNYPLTGPDYLRWEADNHTLAVTSLYAWASQENLVHSGEAVPATVARVQANFFSTLGVRPMAGRDFAEGEDSAGRNHVALLSYGIWQQQFGGRHDIIGDNIELNEQAYTVIGVMPRWFTFTNRADIYAPFDMSPKNLGDPGTHQWRAIGRLKPGVTPLEARADLTAIEEQLGKLYPDNDAGVKAIVVPLQAALRNGSRGELLILLGAVALVLLIACANIAGLMLARAANRGREMALRAALGAGRWRLVRQLLTESVTVAMAGGATGLVAAYWIVQYIQDAKTLPIPPYHPIAVDFRVLLFAFAVSILVGILFGLAPALQASDARLVEQLKSGSQSVLGVSGARLALRDGLVVAEIALSLALLVGAGLLLRTFSSLRDADIGVERQGLITMGFSLPAARYPKAAQRRAFMDSLLAKVRQTPGVNYAAVSSKIPLEGGTNGYVKVPGNNNPEFARQLVEWNFISPEYFHTCGTPLLRGRDFTADDMQQAADTGARLYALYTAAHGNLKNVPPDLIFPAIISQTMARTFWPNQNPLGKVFSGVIGKEEVIGVAGDIKQYGIKQKTSPEAYFPFTSALAFVGVSHLAVRTSLTPLSLVEPIRRDVASLDSGVPVYDVRTMQQVVDDHMYETTLQTFLLGLFAALALFLAATGVYGVMAYLVARRTREFGIRMALGAEKSDVLRMVIGQGLKLALIGVAIGVVGAFILTRFLASLLYGVKPTDPLTFTAVSLILIAVALLACYIPARRAAKVDPLVALRYE
jgi:putative ABC transport system permease protein